MNNFGYVELGDSILVFRRPPDEEGAIHVEVCSADHLPKDFDGITTPEQNEAGRTIFRLRTKKIETLDGFIKEFQRAREDLLKAQG